MRGGSCEVFGGNGVERQKFRIADSYAKSLLSAFGGKRRAELAGTAAHYAMFASGIIARSAYHWQTWMKAC